MVSGSASNCSSTGVTSSSELLTVCVAAVASSVSSKVCSSGTDRPLKSFLIMRRGRPPITRRSWAAATRLESLAGVAAASDVVSVAVVPAVVSAAAVSSGSTNRAPPFIWLALASRTSTITESVVLIQPALILLSAVAALISRSKRFWPEVCTSPCIATNAAPPVGAWLHTKLPVCGLINA